VRDTVAGSTVLLQALHQAAFTEKEARELYRQGEQAVVTALQHYLLTGQLPPLPPKTTSVGCSVTEQEETEPAE
jgi:hypothetical protein